MSTLIKPVQQTANAYKSVGAIVHHDGVFFRIWAPQARRISLVIDGHPLRHELSRVDEGYFEGFVQGVKAGDHYHYTLDGERLLPDPGSRSQPFGVHGPSQVIDPWIYRWHDQHWTGIEQKDLVIYEVHTGVFTEQGTFQALEEKLEYLKKLGIRAIELMPIAEFAGRWNWGYDPAALYAPSHRYGTPDDLRRLVDKAHQIGIAVFLDVVYNHFGPDGSYAALFGHFFSRKHCSPWGQGVNLDDVDSRGVRNFFIDNALHWFREYHIDGLRLDATHALQDDSQTHFLAELSAAVESLGGRKRFLIAEDERNLARLTQRRAAKGYGLDAVWADDFHHQVRNLTAGDTEA